jgi:regulator of replication initiation timing
MVKMRRDIPYTKEVLIGQEDLEDKILMIKNLTVRMRELESEHAYKLRLIDVQHNDKLRDVHHGYCEAIKELRDKLEKLQEDHTNEINNINVEIVKMKTTHAEVLQQTEKNYEQKLIIEFDKYQAFEEQNNLMREGYEKQLQDLEKRDAEKLQKTVTKYEDIIHENKIQLEEVSDEMTHKEHVHQYLITQMEDDADREILAVRTDYENLLYEERQSNLKLKGEAGMMRNRFMASQKDVEGLKRHVERVQAEYAEFHKNIHDLGKQIADLKKEIIERDATIQDKEKQIYDIKRINQELEKYKFVLNYKIQELRNQIEPRDREIEELKQNMRDIEAELLNLHKLNKSLEIQLHEVKEKLNAAHHEISCEKRLNKICEQLLRKIRVDILDVAGFVQEPNALKVAVKNLYHKYNTDDEFLRSRKADLAAECEFIKQRDFLEKTVMSLKKQVFKDTYTDDKDLGRMIEENSILIVELNTLREKLKEAREEVSYMENILGLTRKDVRPAEAKKVLEQAYHGYEELTQKYGTQMREYQQIIIELKNEIKRLLNKIPCEEIEKVKKNPRSLKE